MSAWDPGCSVTRGLDVKLTPDALASFEASLERMATAILVEIDEKWLTTDKPYITWKTEDDRSTEIQISRLHGTQAQRLARVSQDKHGMAG